MTYRHKLWVGIGAAVLTGTPAAAGTEAERVAQAAPAPPHAHGAPAKSPAPAASPTTPAAKDAASPTQSGEGGEGAAGTVTDPRVRFYRDLGLVRGHLLVGDELVAAGRWDEALPHFLHPGEEIYANLAPALARHGIRPFDTALAALAQTVKAQRPEAYKDALARVRERVDEAEITLQKFASQWTQVQALTVLALLEVAAGEYGQAIEAGRIAKPVEYQDARGFVWEADRMLGRMGPRLDAKDKAAAAVVRQAMAELKVAWPTPVPPPAPVMTTEAVAVAIAKLTAAAAPFVQP